MGVKERKNREKDLLRQAILEAAGEIFIKEGYENVSMRKIAEKIEYSPTTIYLYFKDKADLFRCLIEENFAVFMKKMKKKIGEDYSDPLACIKKGMRAYIEFGLEYPNYYKLIFMSDLAQIEGTYLEEGTFGNEAFQLLKTLVEACIKQNLVQPMDSLTAAQVLWTMNHGVTSLLIVHPDFPWVDKEQLIDQVIETAVNGLKIGKSSPLLRIVS
jgi:AcrR family transcriptional regulator